MVDTSYTYRQGQYLAFIHYYTKVNGIPPAQADIQRYFGVTAPSVNSMLKRLEAQGFIARVARRPRSIRVLIDQSNLPELD
ncbi:MAG: MarR family transcriptional regulator [Gemmatimonadetes bacterium]|nr:MarR family transcriptional regulator [Gemmatimonadota bacterium]